jgi:hypothetical protein
MAKMQWVVVLVCVWVLLVSLAIILGVASRRRDREDALAREAEEALEGRRTPPPTSVG